MYDPTGLFERKIKPHLIYVGTFGAILASIAYIILVFALIVGFSFEQQTVVIVFAGVNAAVGLVILNFLKYQGICFAKEKHTELVQEYYRTKTKDKTNHSMTYFWVKTLATDIFVKGCIFIISTCGLIYIVIKGTQDWNLLLLGIVNLILFISFGIIALNNAYDYYNNEYVNYMKEKINEQSKVELGENS